MFVLATRKSEELGSVDSPPTCYILFLELYSDVSADCFKL